MVNGSHNVFTHILHQCKNIITKLRSKGTSLHVLVQDVSLPFTLLPLADRPHVNNLLAHNIYKNIQFVCLVTNVGIFSR